MPLASAESRALADASSGVYRLKISSRFLLILLTFLYGAYLAQKSFYNIPFGYFFYNFTVAEQNCLALATGNADVAADLTKKFLKGEPLPASNIKLSETFYGTQSSK